MRVAFQDICTAASTEGEEEEEEVEEEEKKTSNTKMYVTFRRNSTNTPSNRLKMIYVYDFKDIILFNITCRMFILIFI